MSAMTRLSWCPLLLTFLFFPLLTQYQYTKEASKEFNLKKEIQTLQDEVDRLKEDLKGVKASQARLSQRFREIERGKSNYQSRRSLVLEEKAKEVPQCRCPDNFLFHFPPLKQRR